MCLSIYESPAVFEGGLELPSGCDCPESVIGSLLHRSRQTQFTDTLRRSCPNRNRAAIVYVHSSKSSSSMSWLSTIQASLGMHPVKSLPLRKRSSRRGSLTSAGGMGPVSRLSRR